MKEGWERQRSYDFEHTRAICYQIAASNSTKKLPKIEDVWPLPTDDILTKEEKENELEETYKRITEKYKKAFPKTYTA